LSILNSDVLGAKGPTVTNEAGGFRSDESLAPISMSARLREVVDIDPAGHAIQFDGSWRNWGYLGSAMRALDAVLEDHGLGPDRPVGVIMRNRPEIVRGIVALLATRRCVVTLSSVIPSATLAEEIASMGLPAVLMTGEDGRDEQLRAALERAGTIGVEMVDQDEAVVGDVFVPDTRCSSYPDVAGVAVQMLTSGTTGAPKRIDLPYRSLEHEIGSTASYSRSEDITVARLRSGTTILWVPLLHIGGMRSLITTMIAGRRIALMERFDVDQWQALVLEHRPKVVSLAPTALRMVLDAQVPTEVFEGIRAVFAGTAPLTSEVADEFLERYGVPVLVVYGATEFAGGVAGWNIGDWERFGRTKRGSVGRPNAGVTIRIVDAGTGDVRPSGEDGIVEVRGPQLGTREWVRTTDLGRMDDDGFLWILGRADDVIIRGGFKVSTTTVKDALARHPAVLDASVIGIPDARLGTVPVAAVELVSGLEEAPTPDELRDFLRGALPPYQVPVQIRIVEALPRTPSMKVSQPEVRRLF
jgi:long-chain acyl-CoA synthetase